MSRHSSFIQAAIKPDTVWRALRLALVVGPMLIIINQWEALLGQAPFNIGKALLTFLVPYCVSTWTAASKESAGDSG